MLSTETPDLSVSVDADVASRRGVARPMQPQSRRKRWTLSSDGGGPFAFPADYWGMIVSHLDVFPTKVGYGTFPHLGQSAGSMGAH